MSDLKIGRIEQLTHTPGPWDRGPMNGEAIDVITPTKTLFVAAVVARVPALHPKAEADARLIAAAPDLFAALCELTRAWDSTQFPVSDRMQMALDDADRAIAKAEGRS
jgi:hypothetical protein